MAAAKAAGNREGAQPMSRQPRPGNAMGPPSTIRRLMAQLRLSAPFYLGFGAPAATRTYPDCRVWAARGHTPQFVRELLALYRGEEEAAAGQVERPNYRCAAIALDGGEQRFFVKQFPWHHILHDLERVAGCSRVIRAWRAAHLLPRLDILTPRAVGRAVARADDGRPMEYLATEWLDDALPFETRLRSVGGDAEARAALLTGLAGHLRHWNDCGIYLRDLVKNVLVSQSSGVTKYWLIDLDQLHPYKSLIRSRLLRQFQQVGHWSGPLAPEEARGIVGAYLGSADGRLAEELETTLLDAEPVEQPDGETSHQ